MSARNKRQAKRQRRIRRHRPAAHLPPNTKIIKTPASAAKISGVLMDFVEPYREPPETLEEMQKLLTLAVLAWNAGLLPSDKREQFFKRTEEALPPEARPKYRTVLEPMIQRKEEQFADDQRCILSFELKNGPKGYSLSVMSSMPGE
jgi:hypothetical protein